MVSPGVVDRCVLSDLRDAGAEWYACYQETHDRALYRVCAPVRTTIARRRAQRRRVAPGYMWRTACYLASGSRRASGLASMMTMRAPGSTAGAGHDLRPADGHAAGRAPPCPRCRPRWSRIATMRLVMPDRLIPASLDIDGIARTRGPAPRRRQRGHVDRPPPSAWPGSHSPTLDIDVGYRTVARRAAAPRAARAADGRPWKSTASG